MNRAASLPLLASLSCLLLSGTGCWTSVEPDLTVYCALDQEFSQPILDDFQGETGLSVQPLFDVESTKTVGLVNRILNERNRPQCDVFWNNEILHTLRLQKEGLLIPCHPSAASSWPEDYQSDEGLWYGFAARARVLIVNTEKLPREQWPESILALADPKWKGRCGIAKPLFGTTATHAAVLFDRWGEQRARRFFEQVAENASVLSGNKQVARAVAEGQLLFGLTDTDDAMIERDRGLPVDWIFPDQQSLSDNDSAPEPLGTLFIPNTLCVIKGANVEAARKLLDYLLTTHVEHRLAEGASAQFPVHPDVAIKSRAATQDDVRWMQVDFPSAARQWETAASILRDLFAQPGRD